MYLYIHLIHNVKLKNTTKPAIIHTENTCVVLSMELITLMNPILALLVLLFVVPKMYNALIILVWQPFVLTRRFKKQGISGPRYRFLYGNIDEINKMKIESHLSILDPNSNDIFPRIFPHYQQWMTLYGAVFTISIFLLMCFFLTMRDTHVCLYGIYVTRRYVSLLERNRANAMHLRS